MRQQLQVSLSEDGADEERLDTLAGYLRDELMQLDVEDVTALGIGEPPPGSRGLEIAAAGALLVSISQSAERLGAVVTVIKRWLSRSDGTPRTVRVEIDGDTLELSGVSPADQQRLIDLFVSRHSGPIGAE
jgi:hypothetical protein